MAAKTVSFFDLPGLAGQDLGYSRWIGVDQHRIDLFAATTDDHQWIHCDVERANRERGGTIAHGFLTLSLLPALSESILNVSGVRHILNYGLNRLRFISPVPAGSRLRVRHKVLEVTGKGEGYQVTTDNQFEIDNCDRAVCVAESVMVYFP